MCVKKKEKYHFQLRGKRHKKDIILALFPSTTIFSSRIKAGSLEFVMSNNRETLANPKITCY